MSRITKDDLEKAVLEVNKRLGRPINPYTRIQLSSGKSFLVVNIGNIHVQYETSGCTLLEMANDNGGVNYVLPVAGSTKSEMYTLIQVYLIGITAGKEIKC